MMDICWRIEQTIRLFSINNGSHPHPPPGDLTTKKEKTNETVENKNAKRMKIATTFPMLKNVLTFEPSPENASVKSIVAPNAAPVPVPCRYDITCSQRIPN